MFVKILISKFLKKKLLEKLDKRLKIAIIGSRGYPYVYSGYETLVKELSERLVIRGCDVRVYCHSSLFKNKPKKVNGVELIYTPSIETKSLSQLVNSFFSFIHVCFSNYDIILVLNTANGPFGLLTTLFGKKTLINVDGLEWLRPKWKGFGAIYFRISSRLSTIFFDHVITDSNEMSKIYKKEFNKESTIIAYGSTMNNQVNNEYLKKYGLKKNNYYLVVGRLIPDNNSRLILDGFLKSKSKKKLVIVGDVPYSDKYADEIKKYQSKKIIFTGYINNQNQLSSIYKNCYAYLHGHEFGGTNPTMINALCLNSQIIALDTPFNNEMLENRVKLLFKKNTNSVKDCINNFEENYLKIKKLNIEYKLPIKYTWNEISKQYTNLFYSLIN